MFSFVFVLLLYISFALLGHCSVNVHFFPLRLPNVTLSKYEFIRFVKQDLGRRHRYREHQVYKTGQVFDKSEPNLINLTNPTRDEAQPPPPTKYPIAL